MSRAKWRESTVRISIDGGRVWHADGFLCDDAPGLAINHASGWYGDRWAITHMQTGYRLTIGYRSVVMAREVAADLAALGDWQRSARAIRRDYTLRAWAWAIVFEALEREPVDR